MNKNFSDPIENINDLSVGDVVYTSWKSMDFKIEIGWDFSYIISLGPTGIIHQKIIACGGRASLHHSPYSYAVTRIDLKSFSIYRVEKNTAKLIIAIAGLDEDKLKE